MIKISWFCHNSPIIFCGVLMEHFLKVTGDSDTTVQSGSQRYQGFLEVFHQITTEYYKWAKRGVRETPRRSKVITPNIHFSALWLCVLILRIKDISSIFDVTFYYPQVILQLLFIQDIARRRIASADQVKSVFSIVNLYETVFQLFRIAQSRADKL